MLELDVLLSKNIIKKGKNILSTERATALDIQYHDERKFFLNQETQKYGAKYTSEISRHHRKKS